MKRKSGVLLFVFICFLIWLYIGIYESSTDNWWTVNEIKPGTEDSVQIGVSFAKVLVGAVIFMLMGFLINIMMR